MDFKNERRGTLTEGETRGPRFTRSNVEEGERPIRRKRGGSILLGKKIDGSFYVRCNTAERAYLGYTRPRSFRELLL